MRFKLVILFALIIFAILIISNNVNTKESKINSEVSKKIAGKEDVKLIVHLSNETRKNIRTRDSEDIIEKKTRRKIKDNVVSVEVSKEELSKVLDDERVVKVEIDYVMKALLQDSVNIVNASLIWTKTLSGYNLTGMNETICIIDTGVNYTHSSLGECYGNNNMSSNCKVIGGYDFINNDGDPIDDNGHGTKVAGIAAANGTINGIAPGARIIAIKSLDSSGSGLTSDIASGINWCVSNSSRFNISVISMSIGTSDVYSSNCDSSFSTLTAEINAAVAKNISVVVASGNSGDGVPRSTTSISSPACITNSTPISATDKNDAIASYAHYNSLVKLFAPGSIINTTTISGSYGTDSGTSMSAPHAAGAIAIINQFLRLANQTRTPDQIELVFNNTGKTITDGSSSFSRINVFTALSNLSFNSVTLISPANNLLTVSNQTFSCNVSTNVGLVNLTLYIWNSSGIETNVNSNISGLINSSNYSYNFTNDGIYKWNCLASNNFSFYKFSNENFSLTYDITTPLINVTTPKSNNSWHNGKNLSVLLNENASCAYSLNNGVNNITMSSTDNRNFNASNNTLIQGNSYNVFFRCNDSVGNVNTSMTYTFRVDLTSPNVSSVSPVEGYSATGTTSVLFEYNVSDNINISLCDLLLNNAVNASNSSSITNGTNNITYSLSAGSYDWNINCTDEAGNTGNSSSRSLTINAASSESSGSSGGSGGGGGAPLVVKSVTYNPTREELSRGYTNDVKKSDSVVFTIYDEKSERHNLSVDDIGSNYVNLTIRSNPIKITLGIGQSVKLNLTSAAYYNLYIKLEDIKENKAKLTIQTISDPIVIPKDEEREFHALNETDTKIDELDFESKPFISPIMAVAILIGFGVLVGFIVHYVDKRTKKRRIK